MLMKYSLAFLLAYFSINFLVLMFYIYKNWGNRKELTNNIEIILVILLAGIFVLTMSQSYEETEDKEKEND